MEINIGLFCVWWRDRKIYFERSIKFDPCLAQEVKTAKMFKRLIKAIEFSISSDQDVLSQSVVEVLYGMIPRGQEELCNTLYDFRMGIIEKGVKCETCSMDYIKCKGHFGHIALAVPVVNPICLKQLKWIVKHICKKWKRIMITKQHLSLNLIKNYKQSSKYIDRVASHFHYSTPLAHPLTSDDILTLAT